MPVAENMDAKQRFRHTVADLSQDPHLLKLTREKHNTIYVLKSELFSNHNLFTFHTKILFSKSLLLPSGALQLTSHLNSLW